MTDCVSCVGNAFSDINRAKLYPTISLKKPGEAIKANFGQEPFVYNIGDAMEVCTNLLTKPYSWIPSRYSSLTRSTGATTSDR